MAKPQKTTMQADPTPKVQMCANCFELVSRWGQPMDKAWARDMLDLWLERQIDSAHTHVYDGGIPLKGNEHVKPQ